VLSKNHGAPFTRLGTYNPKIHTKTGPLPPKHLRRIMAKLKREKSRNKIYPTDTPCLYGHKSFSGDVRLAHINQVASIHPVLNLNADFFTLQRLQNLVKGFYFDQGRGILRSRHQTSP
jgi:hypothetical protein